MLSSDNKVNDNDIILISKQGNEFKFNKKLIIKSSKLIKSIISKEDDEDIIENKIPIIYEDNIVKILCEYFNYLNKNKFNFVFKRLTLDYIFKEFLNLETNENNILIWSFIDKLSIENTKELFDFSRYLNIEILEELTLYNLMIKIKIKIKI